MFKQKQLLKQQSSRRPSI